MVSDRPRSPRLSHESRVFWLALAGGFPALLVALVLLWSDGHSSKTCWTLSILMVGVWLGFAGVLRERVVRPLQTLSNLLAALREGDFSIRARGSSREDALGLALLEVNALAETLRQQRLGALEAGALLARVTEEIDAAVFAFDGEQRLRLVNRAGERLLGQPAAHLLGRDAGTLALAEALAGPAPRVLELSFAGSSRRWEARRSEFRQGGRPHQLLVLSDLSHALREEERAAWQRLVRVLSHEINNSLAPIKSIAGSLQTLLARTPRPASLDDDLRQGLGVVAGRSDALSRFMAAYANLARLPKPKLAPLEVERWITRVAGLETRLRVEVVKGPPLTLEADGDQLDQLLINLVRNAVDAALETRGAVRVRWSAERTVLAVSVEDEGPGLSETENLFVPFFTTKPNGSGVGLALSRQIAEAHGGTLTLENRTGARGCVARLTLPLRRGVKGG